MKIIKGIINVLTTLIIVIGGIFLILYVCGIVPYVVLSGSMEPTIETGSVCFINKHTSFDSIKEKLDFDSSRETLDQAYMRWFKKNNVTLTLPLVGTCFYSWDPASYLLDKLCDNLSCDDLLGMAEKIRNAKHSFYESLETSVQAEPYNSHDKNSILVCIESPEAKIAGNPGLEKAGHIRALAAKIIRESKPKKMAYTSKLAYLGGDEIVVSVEL